MVKGNNMVTYTISLVPDARLEVDASYVVKSTTYQIVATDGINTVEWSSKIEFPAPGEDFVPFANLTKQDVLAWIENVHADKIVEMKNFLANELAERAAPIVTLAPAPWSE